ncbi:putative glycoside hydrolase, partial [Hungatella hathewayi]
TMKQVVFDEADTRGRSKTDIITEFITYAYDKLSEEGVFVSADVFGTIIGSKIDADAVGQVYNDMAKHLDYICPMIYPSHYGDGNFGIEHPDTQPYDTILAALMKSKQDLAIVTAAGEDHAIVRPWLQDFTASYLQHYIKYGPAEVRAQIQAVYDAGYDEWILWSASNKYTWDGLLSPEEAGREDQKIAESRAALPPETTAVPPTEAADGETQPAPEETLPQEGQPSEETTMEETEAPVDGTTASEELQTGEDAETEAAEKAAAQPETAAQGEKRSKPNVVIVTTGGAGE